ncbi:MAG: hypothetical protein WC890_04835 [Candidatus Margulisiibacteriota bacterium]
MAFSFTEIRAALVKPYSQATRLLGDRTSQKIRLNKINGSARRTIAQALTYHGIPQKIYQLILEKLPSEKQLRATTSTQQQYLSFTVYSLKNMLAAGTISAETAWTMFEGEWNHLDQVEEGNFAGMRRTFWQQARSTMGDSAQTVGRSLLEFEFYARAGQAGLAQFERYGQWAEALLFDQETCRDMYVDVKDEYRKALWIEMRMIEGQVGIQGMNEDVRMFRYVEAYDPEENAVGAKIDVFNGGNAIGAPVDIGIKAEIGHWMFAMFRDDHREISELMDRMNNAAYTARVADELNQLLCGVGLSPSIETRAFLIGGGYCSALNEKSSDKEAYFPVFPARHPLKIEAGKANVLRTEIEDHSAAEYIDQEIRHGLVGAVEVGKIEAKEIYAMYRKTGLYVALLDMEGETMDEILAKIRNINPKEIDSYCDNWKDKRQQGLLTLLNHGDVAARLSAIKLVSRFRERDGNPKIDAAFKAAVLYVANVHHVKPAKYLELLKFLMAKEKFDWALPQLENNLLCDNLGIVTLTAKAMCGFSDSKPTAYLQTLSLFDDSKWDEIVALGQLALPALEKLAQCEGACSKLLLVKVVGRIGGEEAARILQRIDGYDCDEMKINLAYYLAKNGDMSRIQFLIDSTKKGNWFDQNRARCFLDDLHIAYEATSSDSGPWGSSFT